MTKPSQIVIGKLKAAGVRNLKKFGYPECTVENITKDTIYSRFFKSMLDDHSGNRVEVEFILDEIKSNAKEGKLP